MLAPDQRGNVNDAHRNARFVLENLGNGMPIDEVMKQFPVSRSQIDAWRGGRLADVQRTQRMLRHGGAGSPENGSEAGRGEQQRRRSVGQNIEAADAEDVMVQES